MSEVTIEHADQVFETETWAGKIKCPLEGCRGTTETKNGMNQHLSQEHGLSRRSPRPEVDCEVCGETFRPPPQNSGQKACSIRCGQILRWRDDS